MNFEESMKELENIVKSMEDGTMPIEESISAFEKGIALVKDCRKLLDSAEKKVNALVGEIKNEKETD